MNIPAPRRCVIQCLALGLGLFAAVGAARGQRTALAMGPAVISAGVVDTGPLAATQAMQIAVYMTPDAARQAALAQYLKDVQTPGSGAYHAWLTKAEFAQRFGATQDEEVAVAAYAAGAGLVSSGASASGLRMMFSGTAAQVEAAFAPGLHGMQVGSAKYVANTAVPTVPAALAGTIGALRGLDTLPAVLPLTLASDGGAAVVLGDALSGVSDAVEANAARVITLATSACIEDVDAASQGAMRLALEQASAEGVTVLASTGCGARGSAGFPSVLAEATSLAPTAGVTPPVSATLTELRPVWQVAMGLPADGFRHEPDLSVSSAGALALTLLRIMATEPANADGSAARLGNVNATLYELAAEPGLYTQPDGAAAGTWEAPRGLGVVSLPLLEKFYPRGSLSVNVSIAVSNGGYVTHGQSLTFSSTVTDTSGQGNGAVPTGTVTFATSTGVALGSAALSGGSASVSYNQLPGGSYQVQASYSGDGTYAAGQSIQTGFTVAPEAVQLTATAGAGSVGGTVNITVTATSTSGVGTPSGTVTVVPQGTTDTTTYSGTLSGSGASASAIVAVAAVQGGADVFKANCTTNASFTCYTPQNVTAQVSLGTPSITVTANPVAPTNGQTDTITVTVAGKGGVYPTPSGNINFYDNGTQLGSKTLSSGSATFTTQALTGSSHSFSATYGGDNNYNTVTAQAGATNTAASATTLALTISPNPPVAGGTTQLTAALTFTLTNSTAPTGTVNFYEDGSLLGSASASGGTAVYTSQALSGTTSHQFYAVYSGDTNYQASTSPTVTTAAAGTISTTTTLGVSPNPPVSGSATTLTATVTPASGTATPTGTVAFYEDGALLTNATVSGGIASYQSTALSGTTSHAFYAVYSGSTTYATSTSPTVTTSAATAGSTTTTLTVSPNPPVSGSTTTLTATVAYTLNNAAPTGSVTFYQDGTAIGTGTLSGTSASFTSTALSSTTAHTYTATYSGDTNYKASTSAAVTTAASGATVATTTALTVSPNPPVSGSTTTLSAAIAYTGSTATPTGTVQFYQDGVALASAAVSSGAATYTTTTLSSKASHAYYAVYSGDSTFKASTSSTITTAATSGTTTTTTVTAASTSVATGGTDTLTATVTPASTVNGASPTGTVTFTSAQGALCTATLASGSASCSATLTTTGTQSITATYGGDTNYAGSTSTAAATVTVGATSAGGTLTVTASPSTNVMYGASVTLTATLTPTTAVTGGPAGTVTFSLAGTTTVTYTATLVANGTTSATATYVIPTPVPGTYVITASCTSTNVTCTTITATASLSVIKGNTATTVTASPTSPLAGQTTTFTATVAPTVTPNAGAISPTGTVTFYINGVSTVVALSNGTATYSTVLTSTSGNYVTAVYSGDTNWNGSTSSQLIVNIAPVPTTGTLTASETTALYGANIILKDNIVVAPTTLTPYPVSPTGTVTFYDLYNGQPTLLGTASVTQIVLGDSIAQFTTTGLLVGTHLITAVFNGGTAYATSTATLTINIDDYAVTYSPTTLNLGRGSSGAVIATVTPENGFSGQVVLGCTPPAGAEMSCSFSPAVITAGGTSVLTVQTTAATAALERPRMARGGTMVSLAAVSLGTLLLGLLLPRRRRPALLLALVAGVLAVSAGCSTQGVVNTQSTSGSGATNSSGTPLGTQLLTITTQGTDGITTVRHDTQFQVTVQ